MVPLRVDRLLTSADRGSLERSLEETFWRTNVEIICALAGESRRYERPGWCAGLSGGVLLLGLSVAWGGSLPAAWGLWNGRFALGLAWHVVALTAGVALGYVVGERWEWLRRLMTPADAMRRTVEEGAALAFSLPRDPLRPRRLLIYVSAFERSAMVLADPVVREALGPERIEELAGDVAEQFGAGRFLQGLLAAAEKAGAWLEGTLPPESFTFDDRPGHVWVFDPRPIR